MGIGGIPVYLPWKSVESGRYDKLIAKIEGTPADSVFFSRESASMVMTAPGKTPGEKQLMITGQGHRNEDELFAWYRTYTGDSVKKVTNWLAQPPCGDLFVEQGIYRYCKKPRSGDLFYPFKSIPLIELYQTFLKNQGILP